MFKLTSLSSKRTAPSPADRPQVSSKFKIVVKETKRNGVLLRGNEEGQGAHGQDVARSPVQKMRKRTREPADSLPVVDLATETVQVRFRQLNIKVVYKKVYIKWPKFKKFCAQMFKLGNYQDKSKTRFIIGIRGFLELN